MERYCLHISKKNRFFVRINVLTMMVYELVLVIDNNIMKIQSARLNFIRYFKVMKTQVSRLSILHSQG